MVPTLHATSGDGDYFVPPMESDDPGSSCSGSVELSSLSPGRKRVRCDSQTVNGPPGKIQALSNDTDTDMEASSSGLRGTCKRDSKYYLEDGSCILLVEDTLFNASQNLNFLFSILTVLRASGTPLNSEQGQLKLWHHVHPTTRRRRSRGTVGR